MKNVVMEVISRRLPDVMLNSWADEFFWLTDAGRTSFAEMAAQFDDGMIRKIYCPIQSVFHTPVIARLRLDLEKDLL